MQFLRETSTSPTRPSAPALCPRPPLPVHRGFDLIPVLHASASSRAPYAVHICEGLGIEQHVIVGQWTNSSCGQRPWHQLCRLQWPLCLKIHRLDTDTLIEA